MGFWPCPVTAAMALNIWDVMFLGRALTALVKSERKRERERENVLKYVKEKNVIFLLFGCIPAMFMLAGVAFTDAGVRVLLLLLGVMPSERKIMAGDQKHNYVLNIK